jgi:DNA invertase Pin-like site-specific DNA recombinase
MKTQKELGLSPAKLSEPWRNIGKGEQVKAKRTQVESEQLKFRLGPYIRLSPTGDHRDEGSLVSHPQRIRQFVESKVLQHGSSWGEIVEWYEDKDLSGKDMNRPSFQRMLADIRSGKINAVIVTELSRLNRKVKDFCEVWEFFKENNVTLFSLKENFDTSTPMGELMLIQAMSFAQFERQTIVDRIKKGARARAERGLANGYIPLGFNAVEHRPNHREINEAEREYVEMIFRKFLELKRISRVVNFLNGKGYRTKEFIAKSGKKVGGNRWTVSSMHNLLTNRAYLGEREINKQFRSADPSGVKDDDRYFFVDAHWPALVAKDLFFDVQNLLEQNKKKARKYVHEYRLTGLIECAECGAKLVGKSGGGRNGKYFYYGHKRKMVTDSDRHLQRCKIESIPALQIEEAVISRMKDLSSDRELVRELIRSTASGSQDKLEHQKALMAAKEQDRRKLAQKLDNLYDAISEESDKELRAGLSQKAKDTKVLLEKVETALLELRQDYDRANNVVDIADAMESIKVFREGGFEAQPLAAQAEILKKRIRRMVVREGGVYVEIYGKEIDPGFRHSDEGGSGARKSALSSLSGSTRPFSRTVSKLVGPPWEKATFLLQQRI